ncbi:NAD-binding protein [Rossellomorea aquimaris]|uniref:NAD-binding protein n=1 Tax=Rossellomorea aquimaris TaxID=189382 RepID=UPI001CD657F4|nr:NAD-binding protein [Rossellomorea aquimaris]MCA1060829.1 NAD-binding protein [Rossellomorea aquimaris]
MKTLKRIKNIHLALAFIFSIVLAWKFRHHFRDESTYFILFLATVWGTLGLYFLKLKPLTIIRTILLIITFAFGMYGFYYESYPGYSESFFDAIYSTVHLFILTLDPVFNSAANPYGEIPMSIEVARWTAALYTISTISLIVLRIFGQSVRGTFQRYWGGHIIIAGFSKKAASLIENLKREGYSVTVIQENLVKEDQEWLHELGVAFYTGEKREYFLYRKSGLSKAEHVVIIHEDDSMNLDNYLSMREYLEHYPPTEKLAFLKKKLKNSSEKTTQLTIHIHLNHTKSLQVFEGLTKEESGPIRAYSFSSHQLIAEKMLENYPLYKGYENQLRKPDGEPLHLLFIGFGRTNQQLAFQALNLSHFLTKKKIRLTILDKDIDKAKKEWGYLAKFADEIAVVDFRKADLSAISIKDELPTIGYDITHVFLALRDDYLDMVEGLEAAETWPDIPIFIKMKDDLKLSLALHEDNSEYKHIQKYIYDSEVLNSESILKVNSNKLAEEAHGNYMKRRDELKLSVSKPWHSLDEFKQESTRYQMLHSDTKLMLLGLKKVVLGDSNYSEEILSAEQYAEYIKDYINPIAYVEHERWNAFHFLRGWQPAGDSRATREELDKLKLHKYLVRFEDLEEEIKDYDRDSIIYLNEYYYAQGYGLVIK